MEHINIHLLSKGLLPERLSMAEFPKTFCFTIAKKFTTAKDRIGLR
jgi:hypothetical protein